MLTNDPPSRARRARQLPRGTPAIWFLALAIWLALAPREYQTQPLPYALTLAAFFLTRWQMAERRPAGLVFLSCILLLGALVWRWVGGAMALALSLATLGIALLLTAGWSRPPWPALRGAGWLCALVGALAALLLHFAGNG